MAPSPDRKFWQQPPPTDQIRVKIEDRLSAIRRHLGIEPARRNLFTRPPEVGQIALGDTVTIPIPDPGLIDAQLAGSKAVRTCSVDSMESLVVKPHNMPARTTH